MNRLLDRELEALGDLLSEPGARRRTAANRAALPPTAGCCASAERPHARLRLFCFPTRAPARRSSTSGRSVIQEEVEVLPVQFPGRETRFREPLHCSGSNRSVEALAPVARAELDRPFAFFGYSLGGLVAFETARELRRAGSRSRDCC